MKGGKIKLHSWTSVKTLVQEMPEEDESKQKQNKSTGKRSTVGEEQFNKNILPTQSNVRFVAGCAQGYATSELWFCLFSVPTFLRDNPLPVLNKPHTASP